MNNMKIRNKNLAIYLGFKLNKIGDEFTAEELSALTELNINQLNDFGEFEEVDFEVLDYAFNLETLILRNCTITDELLDRIKKLKNLKSISFEECIIDDFNKIGELDVEYLAITKNAHLRTDFLKGKHNYKGLILTDSDLIDISNIEDMPNLDTLYVSNSDVKNPELISNFKSLVDVSIYGTDISNIKFLEELPELKSVGIDRELYISSKDTVSSLEENGVVFLENGYIPLSDERLSK